MTQTGVFTRKGVERIMRYALNWLPTGQKTDGGHEVQCPELFHGLLG